MDQEWYNFIELIAPTVMVLLPAVLICYGVLRFQYRKRDRLAKECKGWAIIHLWGESFHRPDCASIRILKVDGEKAKSFLYKWPGHGAVFVKPDIHDLEARAEWSFLTGGPDRIVWWNYKVERLQAVIVDPDTEYALEFNTKTDTWTLYRLGKVGEKHGPETVEERFTHLGGDIQHYRIVQYVLFALMAAAFLFINPGLYTSLIHHKYYIFMAVGILLSLLVLYAVVRWDFLRRGRLEAQRKGWAVIHLRRESRHRPGSSSIRIRKVDGKRTHFFLSRFLRCREVFLKPGMHDLEVRARWSVDTLPAECAWHHYKAGRLQAVFMDPKTEYALEYNWKTDTWTLYRLGKVGEKHGPETVEKRFAHLKV